MKTSISFHLKRGFLRKSLLERFLIQWTGNILGLLLVSLLISSISLSLQRIWVLVLAGLVFGLVNFFLKPIFILFALGAIIFTFGLFIFIINGFLLYLTSLIIPYFEISGFSSAIFGSIIISTVNLGLHYLLRGHDEFSFHS